MRRPPSRLLPDSLFDSHQGLAPTLHLILFFGAIKKLKPSDARPHALDFALLVWLTNRQTQIGVYVPQHLLPSTNIGDRNPPRGGPGCRFCVRQSLTRPAHTRPPHAGALSVFRCDQPTAGLAPARAPPPLDLLRTRPRRKGPSSGRIERRLETWCRCG